MFARTLMFIALLHGQFVAAQKKIVICYASGVGHGHYSVAHSLAQKLVAMGVEKDCVVLKDFCATKPSLNAALQEHLYLYLPKEHPDLYYVSYKLTDTFIYPLVQSFLMDMFHDEFIQSVLAEDPAIVIATQAFAAGSLARAKIERKLSVPLITVVTDIYPHYSWIFPFTNYYWVMNSDSKVYLEHKGVSPEKIIVGGLPVASAFVPAHNRAELLKQWNFSPERFTLLLLNGGWGVGVFKEILQQLQPLADKISCFVVCGHNYVIKSELEAMQYNFPVHILGFTDQVPALMNASDLIIGKPGGVTMAESLVMGIPLAIINPIPGQETYNAEFLTKNKAAFYLKRPTDIRGLLRDIFANPELLARKRQAIKKIAQPQAAQRLAEFVVQQIA